MTRLTGPVSLLLLALSGCMVATQPAPKPTFATHPPEYQPAAPTPPPEPPPATQPQPTYAPPRHLHAIHVVAGSYGQNCRAARGNVTPHLQQSCDGQSVCAYRVDYKVIGDPAYGCQKDYVAEWTCGRDPAVRRAVAAPEAGYGSVVQLSCEAGAPTVVAPPPPPPPPPPPRRHGIHVVAGTYGQNCRAAYSNVTTHLQQMCEGQVSCAYRVDYKVIGDPAYGCRKDYVAEWTCGNNPAVSRATAAPEAGFGSIVQLTCAPAVAPPLPPPAAAPPPPPPPAASRRSRSIHVVAASYGQNCRAARGNVTAHLQQLCEGHSSCTYRVDYRVIGDPAYGCLKDYVAEWRCGNHPGVRRATAAPEAGFGSTVELRCD
jgi:hypothetical protein